MNQQSKSGIVEGKRLRANPAGGTVERRGTGGEEVREKKREKEKSQEDHRKQRRRIMRSKVTNGQWLKKEVEKPQTQE